MELWGGVAGGEGLGYGAPIAASMWSELASSGASATCCGLFSLYIFLSAASSDVRRSPDVHPVNPHAPRSNVRPWRVATGRAASSAASAEHT